MPSSKHSLPGILRFNEFTLDGKPGLRNCSK
jgi:hypothetical protein